MLKTEVLHGVMFSAILAIENKLQPVIYQSISKIIVKHVPADLDAHIMQNLSLTMVPAAFFATGAMPYELASKLHLLNRCAN